MDIKRRYLKETGTKTDLVIWFFITGFFMILLFDGINEFNKYNSQNKIKLEITGYFRSIEDGHNEILITLTNKERYSLHGVLCYSAHAPFNKDKFINEVKEGDELHFVIWQNDKRSVPYIYQLECNGIMYLYYNKAISTIQRKNIFILLIILFFNLFSGSFLAVSLLRYVKLKLNKEKPEEVKKDNLNGTEST